MTDTSNTANTTKPEHPQDAPKLRPYVRPALTQLSIDETQSGTDAFFDGAGFSS